MQIISKRHFKKRNTILSIVSLLFFVVGLTLPFIGGFYSSDTQLEKNAQYITNVVNNNTKSKKYCCVTVQSTSDSGPILDSYTEFLMHYGAFRQTRITFASTINPDKNHDIQITINDKTISDNLSVLYVGPVGTNEYKGHFKHYIYPIEVMFADERMYDVSEYVMYISQTHADKLLDERGELLNDEGNYSDEQYKSLLKTIVPVNVDGIFYNFAIQNIYYQTNYYYDGLSDAVGDFVLTSYFFPKNLRSEQKNMYFMSGYDYQNLYFMKYIINSYSNGKYLVRLNNYNIVGSVDTNYLLSFYYSLNSSPAFLSTMLAVIGGLILLCAAFIYYLVCDTLRKVIKVLNYGILLIPYLIFYVLYCLFNDVMFLARSSTKIYLIFAITSFAILTIVPLIKEKLFRNALSKDKNNDIEEIEI